MWSLKLSRRKKRLIVDENNEKRMLNYIKAYNFLKVDHKNCIEFETANTNKKTLSI